MAFRLEQFGKGEQRMHEEHHRIQQALAEAQHKERRAAEAAAVALRELSIEKRKPPPAPPIQFPIHTPIVTPRAKVAVAKAAFSTPSRTQISASPGASPGGVSDRQPPSPSGEVGVIEVDLINVALVLGAALGHSGATLVVQEDRLEEIRAESTTKGKRIRRRKRRSRSMILTATLHHHHRLMNRGMPLMILLMRTLIVMKAEAANLDASVRS